jgi:hypothetical protein
MRRKTFDALMATGGLVLAVVLLAAGLMLTWAHSFVTDQVNTQLSAQQIYFPDKGSESLADPAVKPYLAQYAGQQLTTGAQAKAYADHYIAVHINEMSGGKTYSQLSEESRANPEDQKLAGMVQTVFRGETLRGLLLNAYAFDTMGRIAFIGSVVAYIGAAALFLLALLGYAHARRTAEDEVLGHHKATTPVPATA